jgi:nucleoid-associated protein YgaU
MTSSHTTDRAAWPRVASATRGVAAAVALVGLLVGPPLALLRWSRWPITGLPTTEQLRDLPTTVVSDAALLTTLTVALWAAWAAFALCVLVEVAAEVRGRAPRRLPAGPLQPLARALVAAVAMTIGSLAPLPGAHASPTAAASTAEPPPATTPPEPTDPQADPPPEPPPPAAPTPSEPGLIEVVADDDPWTLAATHLGDGARWRELWDANRDRVQPDGQRWTIGHHIEPGWTLALPSAPAAPTPAPPNVITVAEADTAWDVAAAHLGDPARWPELFDANKDRPQPDGGVWTDPDVLRIGWQLTIPGGAPAAASAPTGAGSTTSAPGTAPPPEPAPSSGAAPPNSVEQGNAPAIDPAGSESPTEQEEPSDSNEPAIGDLPPDATEPTVPTADTPSPPAPDDPPAARDESSSPPPQSPDADRSPTPADTTTTATAPPDTTSAADLEGAEPASRREMPDRTADGERSDDDETGAPAVPLLGVAGSVLAVALARAWRRRRAVRATTLPTTVVPPPPPASSRPAAQEILAADEAESDRLDLALANLAAGVRARSGRPCVQPRLVQVSPQRIEVLLDRAEPAAPSPWRPEGSGLIWVLDAADEADLAPPDDVPAPLPALATIGTGDSTLHLDLEAYGAVSLTGDPERCRSLARSIVTELAARADGTMGIDIVGNPLDIDVNGRGLPGIRPADPGEIDSARVARLVDELEACRWPHTFAARASGRRAQSWVPFVRVTDEIDHPHLREMVDMISHRPGASSVLLVVGQDAGAGLRIELDPDGGFAIPDLGLTGQAQQIDAPTVDQAADLLADAEHLPVAQTLDFPGTDEPDPATDAPDHGDATTDRHEPSRPTPFAGNGDDYHDPEFDVLVRVCGDIHVEGGTERLANLETAVTVYVALHGETTVERIRDAVWNGTAVSHKRVRNVISNARSTLGDAIRWVDEGRIAAGDGLLTDLELVRRRLAYAARQTSPEAKATTLHGALEWVAGRVCTSPAGNGWTWIDLENWIPQAESLVGTAACDLARLCLELGDPEAACWAASQGIAATGPRDHLAVLLARGYEQAGDVPAARATLTSYLSYAAELGVDEHSDDLHELLDRHVPAAPRRAAS